MQRRDIDTVIADCLIGKATDEEQELLQEWLKEDEQHLQYYQRLIHTEDINGLYRLHSEVDVDKAWKKFINNNGLKQTKRIWLRPLRYAAAILVLLIAGGAWQYSRYIKVTPPDISEDILSAMTQSRESGKQVAKLDVIGSNVDLSDPNAAITFEEYSGNNSSHEVDDEMKHNPLSTKELKESLTKEQLLAARRITTRHDKEFWLTLDDGTLVHLNYNTRLIYPEEFGRGDRNVILDGEAYFMVAKDKSRPFIVHTTNGDIKVYGTEFNVNTRERKDSNDETKTGTSVVLVSGSVSFTPAGGKELMMKPGQQVMFDNDDLSVGNVDVEPLVAWNAGKFSFDDVELERVVNVLSKWYNVSISYASDDIRHQKVIGYFDRYEPLESTLRAITLSVGLRFRYQKENIIIER